MNGLAALAGGEVLMLANDDLMLDPGCVDAGVQLLNGRPEVGLVGALLRDQQGLLSHAGINIDLRCSSYHLLDRLLSMERVPKGLIPTAPVAAVTGALQWIGRDAFRQHPLQHGLPSEWRRRGALLRRATASRSAGVSFVPKPPQSTKRKQPAARTRFRPATAPISFACAPAPGTSWILPPANSCACCCCATTTRIPIVARSGAGRRSSP